MRDDLRREAVRRAGQSSRKERDWRCWSAASPADEKSEGQDESVMFDLVRLVDVAAMPASWHAVRGELENLATKAKQPLIRQMASSR